MANSSKTSKISELLKLCTVGPRQTSGIMTVIPLLSTRQDDRFGSPRKLATKTTNYGNMSFNNKGTLPTIIAPGFSVVTNQAAQDHAKGDAYIIDASKKESFNNCACIQQSQGGYIKEDTHDFFILPHQLRSKALSKKNDTSFSKLWDDISRFNRELGLSSHGHVEYFLEGFKDQLDQFIAQFEPIPGQVGAIILMNGKVAGIERCPNEEFFLDMWEPLIRVSYGSLAIQVAKGLTNFAGNPFDIHKSIDVSSATTISDIENALKEGQKLDYENVRNIVNNFVGYEYTSKVEQTFKTDFTVETIDSDMLEGQIVRDGENVVFASVISKDYWVKNNDWINADEFSM